MKPKKIKTLEDYVSITDEEVIARGTAVATGMPGNTNFPNPPVDPAVLKAAVGTLAALMAESRDGSKKVMAEKRKQRETVIQMLRLEGRYVEVNCKNDIAIYKSSGFQPASGNRKPSKQLSHAVRKIEHGPVAGELLVQLKKYPKALSYNLRSGPVGTSGMPTTWTTTLVTNVKTPVSIKGLTPGTMYAFQVQTMTKSGLSDWSDSVTFMCT